MSDAGCWWDTQCGCSVYVCGVWSDVDKISMRLGINDVIACKRREMQDVDETHNVDVQCVYVVCEVMWIRSAWGWINDVIACKRCEMQDVGETHNVDVQCVYVVCEVMWIRSAWDWGLMMSSHVKDVRCRMLVRHTMWMFCVCMWCVKWCG